MACRMNPIVNKAKPIFILRFVIISQLINPFDFSGGGISPFNMFGMVLNGFFPLYWLTISEATNQAPIISSAKPRVDII